MNEIKSENSAWKSKLCTLEKEMSGLREDLSVTQKLLKDEVTN